MIALEAFGWGQAALSVAFLGLLWYTASSIVAWHRLRHIPGPFLASFSYLWGSWTVTTARSHHIMETEQKKYGSVMRIAPDAIAIYDPETLFRINGARSTYTKGAWYKSLRLDWRGDNLATELDIIKHGQRKAKLVSGFNGKGLVNLEGKIDEWMAALVRCIRGKIAKGEAKMDIGVLLQYFQVDLITQAGLGAEWGDLADEKDHFGYLKLSDVALPLVNALGWFPAARVVMSSTWLLRLFGPKTTDKSGLGQFLRWDNPIILFDNARASCVLTAVGAS